MARLVPKDIGEAESRLKALYDFIWKARHAYYTLDEPFLSDAIYDDLFREAENIETAYEGMKESVVAHFGWDAAPTDVVGSGGENPYAQ